MASQSKIKVFLLLLTIAPALLFTGRSVFACSVSNPDDCVMQSECSTDGGTWQSTSCVYKYANLSNITSTEATAYRTSCLATTAGNTCNYIIPSCSSYDSYGECTNYKPSCYCIHSITPGDPWSVSGSTKLCGCSLGGVVEPEKPETLTSVQLAADSLGLKDISISGIFAGQLSINQLVQFIILTVMSILMLVLLFIIIKSGIAYAGSGDDEQKKKGAIKGITNALIGAAIVFGSYLILSIFFSFFGLSPFKKIVPITAEDCEELTGDAKTRCLELVNEE